MSLTVTTHRIGAICVLTGGITPAGFCRSATGSMKFSTGPIEEKGAGGIMVLSKGTQEATIDFECFGPLKADLAFWYAAGSDAQVANFPTFLVVDDDTAEQWVLSNGQPSGGVMTIPADSNSAVKFKLSATFGKVAAPASKLTPVWASTSGHLRRHAVVSLDAAAIAVNSCEISQASALSPVDPLDAREVGDELSKLGYSRDDITAKISAGLFSKLSQSEFLEVENAYADHDFVITLDNGEAGEDLTFTAANFCAPEHPAELSAGGAVRVWAYDFQPNTGNTFGRIVLT